MPRTQKQPLPANNKLKIISNVVVSTANPVGAAAGCTGAVSPPCNLILNKTSAVPVSPPKYYMPKMLNGMPKYINRPASVPANVAKGPPLKTQKVLYHAHKNQIRTMPPVLNTSVPKGGIKTLSPQSRGISTQQVSLCLLSFFSEQ